jgi:hypothetical protein
MQSERVGRISPEGIIHLPLKSNGGLRFANLPYVLVAFLIGGLHQRQNAATQLHGFYAQEGFDQRKILNGGGKTGQVIQRRHAGYFAMQLGLRRAFEEEDRRDFQDGCDLVQLAGAEAARAHLAFLHVLARHPERRAELLLAHGEHFPAHADAIADVLVDRIGRLLRLRAAGHSHNE